MAKFVAGDDLSALSEFEKMEIKQADEVFQIAKLSDRNLLKPGVMVSKLYPSKLVLRTSREVLR